MGTLNQSPDRKTPLTATSYAVYHTLCRLFAPWTAAASLEIGWCLRHFSPQIFGLAPANLRHCSPQIHDAGLAGISSAVISRTRP